MGEAQPESIMDMQVDQIEKIILNKLPENFDFIEREDVPGLHPEQLQQPGLLCRKIKLSTIRGWLQSNQRTEAFDEPILLALTNVCQKGKLLVFDVRPHSELEIHDIKLCCEIGYGMKTFRGVDLPAPEIVRLFATHSLSKTEMTKPRVILDPGSRIREIRRQRDIRFRRVFGSSNEAEIEKMLRREDRQAEIEFRRNLEALLKK